MSRERGTLTGKGIKGGGTISLNIEKIKNLNK